MILKNEEIKLIKDDFKLRPEEELLLCCARTKVNPEIKDKIRDLAGKNLDWDYLIKMASRHRLKPLLYHNLNSVCPEMVPDDILGELKDYFNGNVRKNLLLTGELIKILELLKAEGIDAVPYKGPVLADLIYGNISLREFNDLDIFINKDDSIKIIEILNSEEYIPYFHINEKSMNNYFRSQKGFIFISENSDYSIDFQWKFSSNFFSFQSSPESVLCDNLN
ncbi:MAG: nucleotidyltransferase family protein, partial [Methanobacterium sp.]|nr:nucleotidyltransferase family protein [Methanobacterium sp.]